MDQAGIAITIALATYNGARTLPRMLTSLSEMRAPPVNWNVIVVDNGSTDDSGAILASFHSRLPLTVLNQPARGKNRALNRALKERLGELVVLTDDDTIVDPDWLCALYQCALDHPEVALFGGAIVPCWEMAPADWIRNSIPEDVAFAITDPAIKEGSISPEKIWGPNMMVRRRIFDQGLRFNENIGPTKGLYIMGSETEFTVRVAALGHKTWFCPQARVQHIIRSHQLDWAWILKRAVRYGRSERIRAVTAGYGEVGQTCLFGKMNFPRWMIRDFVSRYVTGYLLRLLGDAENSAKVLWSAHNRFGYMYQAQAEKNDQGGLA